MSALADLFSENSPSPPATPPRRGEALFLSPGSTPSLTPAKRRRVEYGEGAEAEQEQEDVWGESRGRGEDGDEGEVQGPYVPQEGDAEVLGEGGVRALGDILDGGGARDALALDEEEPKQKRVVAKIDDERLLGRWGVPALISAAKKFKVRGKGQETRDLRRLLDVYQLWAHGMFPKGNFAYTTQRVEVVCRSGRMQNAIAGMREAFERERNPEAFGYGSEGEGEGEGEEEREGERGSGSGSESREMEGEIRGGREVGNGVWVEGDDLNEADPFAVDGGQDGESPRPQVKQPLFDAHDEDDGPDFDEIMAMEEMEREAGRVDHDAPTGFEEEW